MLVLIRSEVQDIKEDYSYCHYARKYTLFLKSNPCNQSISSIIAILDVQSG